MYFPQLSFPSEQWGAWAIGSSLNSDLWKWDVGHLWETSLVILMQPHLYQPSDIWRQWWNVCDLKRILQRRGSLTSDSAPKGMWPNEFIFEYPCKCLVLTWRWTPPPPPPPTHSKELRFPFTITREVLQMLSWGILMDRPILFSGSSGTSFDPFNNSFLDDSQSPWCLSLSWPNILQSWPIRRHRALCPKQARHFWIEKGALGRQRRVSFPQTL